jgi:hypothetical protein
MCLLSVGLDRVGEGRGEGNTVKRIKPSPSKEA